MEHHGTLTPLLPLERQILQEAEVTTPPRGGGGAHGPGGRQAPEPQLPPGGAQAVPQIFTDIRTRDVSADRRNDAWSTGNVLVDTVARMQQDLADIRAENRLLQTPGVPPVAPTLNSRRSQQRKCRCLVGRPVGNSTDMFLTL